MTLIYFRILTFDVWWVLHCSKNELDVLCYTHDFFFNLLWFSEYILSCIFLMSLFFKGIFKWGVLAKTTVNPSESEQKPPPGNGRMGSPQTEGDSWGSVWSTYCLCFVLFLSIGTTEGKSYELSFVLLTLGESWERRGRGESNYLCSYWRCSVVFRVLDTCSPQLEWALRGEGSQAKTCLYR